MSIYSISQVNDIDSLVRFVLLRKRVEAFTAYNLMQVYRKFHEVTQNGSGMQPVGEFILQLEQSARETGVELTPSFGREITAAFLVIEKVARVLGDELSKTSLPYKHEPGVLITIAMEDKIRERYISPRCELQEAEKSLASRAFTLRSSGIPKHSKPESYLNEIRGIIQSMVFVELRKSIVPLKPMLSKEDVKTLGEYLGTSSDEINFLRQYIEKRDEIISEFGSPVTSENRELLIYDLRELNEWVQLVDMPVHVNLGGEDVTGARTIPDVINLIKQDSVNRIDIRIAPTADMTKVTTILKPLYLPVLKRDAPTEY